MTNNPRQTLKGVKRFIIKIGSSSLTTPAGLNHRVIDRLCDELALLKDSGYEFAFVSSGAVAAGRAKARLTEAKSALSRTQALAAIGQGSLIEAYNNAFKRYGHVAAQVLITREDLDQRERYLNIRNTIAALFELGAIPIINENDTVAVEEIQFSDNDMLSAMIIPIVEAQAMIILTDTDGVYDHDPRTNPDAQRLRVIENLKRKDVTEIGGAPGQLGRGGMQSKLSAAYHAAELGIPTVIVPASRHQVITAVLQGEDVGTLVMPKTSHLSQKDHWMSLVTRPKGALVVDDGAARMLQGEGKSLLPVGIVAVEQHFKKGDPVEIRDSQGCVLAVGLSNYASEDVARILGANSKDVCGILGLRECDDEVVHRNNMILKKE